MLNPNAQEYVPPMPIFNGDLQSCVILGFQGQIFDRNMVDDNDLFNPAAFPMQDADFLEIEATEEMNAELAELEELERQQELTELLHKRLEALRRARLRRFGAEQTPAPRAAAASAAALGATDAVAVSRHASARRAPHLTKCGIVKQPSRR
eukprot:TRINITY_DN5626_c0_g1_i1.p1 TRINITY_DN5626_c0_g1~~TRINITY_DN5626_c0_g1_i1.p1  ORF type:complete len:151 (+),score=66.93 TRINITY_DN5626_c0_g1_i1:191-643(+)